MKTILSSYAQEAPAGGTPIEDLVPATIVGILAGAILAWVTVAYRRGGVRPLRALLSFSSRVSGLPDYAALPALIAAISLITAAFGFYWDVSTHIDNGRDPGPFANPSHYFILFGLAGSAVAGWLSVLAGVPRKTRTSIQIGDDWHAPLGGVLVALCGGIALLGFPLDDVWHRLFGQDVTLWGPTHVQMVGGASLTTLALLVLLREGRQHATKEPPSWIGAALHAASGGALLIGLSTLQAEFDFGVPQFRLLNQPVLIMLAAGLGLVAARITGGRGGALTSVLFYLIIRGGLTLAIGPGFGRIIPHFPLYIVEALIVEAVALRVSPERAVRFGLISGIGIGTLGLGAEWLWSHIWMPNPWPAALLPEGALFGFVTAVTAGVVGGLVGRALSPSEFPRPAVPRWIGPAAIAVLVVFVAYPVAMTDGPPIKAQVALEEVSDAPKREVIPTVTLEPRDAADDAIWFELIAWQGLEWDRGASLQVPFEQTGPGTYRATDPVPVHGDWKALVRLHKDDWLRALPIYLPRDSAIPAPEVPAEANFSRDFIVDYEVVQREAVGGNGTITIIAYIVLIAIAVMWLGALAWALARLDRSSAATT